MHSELLQAAFAHSFSKNLNTSQVGYCYSIQEFWKIRSMHPLPNYVLSYMPLCLGPDNLRIKAIVLPLKSGGDVVSRSSGTYRMEYTLLSWSWRRLRGTWPGIES